MTAVMPLWLQKELSECAAARVWPAQIADLSRHYAAHLLQQGLPTRKNERWKYSDLSCLAKHELTASTLGTSDLNIDNYRLQHAASILLVLVNGCFAPQLSDLHRIPPQAVITSLQTAKQEHADLLHQHWPDQKEHLLYQDHPFAALNAAAFIDGLFLYLPDHCQLSSPLHLLSISTDAFFAAHPRHLFILGKQAKLSLIEEYQAPSGKSYLMNTVTNFILKDEARLDYCKLQNEHRDALHFAHTTLKLAHDSHASLSNFSLGSRFARDDVMVHLQAPGSQCKTSGFYRLNHDDQYIDHHISISHEAAHTQSDMNYKGILHHKSRAVFNGRLHVSKDAQKTVAHQANHNLLLSPQAEIYTKPELEIHADDVKCKHGATIGQLDQDALFYLCSRGILHNDAIDMLLQGFADDIFQQIADPAINKHIKEKVA